MPLILGSVADPSSVSLSDNTNAVVLQGKQSELIVSQLHGKYDVGAYRGQVFWGSSLIAGVTIPVNTTTAPTFTLYNPVGSGVNLEMISLDIGWPAAATTVVGTLLGTLSTQTPTATTQGGVTIANPFGGSTTASAARLFTAATITAATTHIPLLGVTSTADAMIASHYEFDGKLLIAPGSLITLTSTPVQTGVAIPSWCWAEWPI